MDKHNEHHKQGHEEVHHERTVPRPDPKTSLSIPLAIVLAGGLIAGAIMFTNKPVQQIAPQGGAQQPTAQAPAANTPVATDLLELKSDDHILGNPNAEVVVIEYSDAQCPFCQRFHDTTKQVISEYGASGKVAWVYRHFPLDQIHPNARKGAEALECASEQGGNEAFYRMLDQVFAPETTSIALSELPQLAAAAGLDAGKMTACLTSGKFAERVNRDFLEGAKVGVRGTPFSVIWNRKTDKQMSINGAYPFETVKANIDQLLAGN